MSTKAEIQSEIRILTGRKASAESELSGVLTKITDAKRDLEELTREISAEEQRYSISKQHADEHETRKQENEATLFVQHEQITKNRVLLANHADHRDELVHTIDAYEETRKEREENERLRIAEALIVEQRALDSAHAERVREEGLTSDLRQERSAMRVEIDTARTAFRAQRAELEEAITTDTRDFEAKRASRLESEKTEALTHQRALDESNRAVARAKLRLADAETYLAEAQKNLAAVSEAAESAARARDKNQDDARKYDRQARMLRTEIDELMTRKTALASLVDEAVHAQERREAEVKRFADTDRELTRREKFVKAMFEKLGYKYR